MLTHDGVFIRVSSSSIISNPWNKYDFVSYKHIVWEDQTRWELRHRRLDTKLSLLGLLYNLKSSFLTKILNPNLMDLWANNVSTPKDLRATLSSKC